MVVVTRVDSSKVDLSENMGDLADFGRRIKDASKNALRPIHAEYLGENYIGEFSAFIGGTHRFGVSVSKYNDDGKGERVYW